MMCELLDQRVVKTRKHHCCFGCLASIPVGSTVERSTIVDSGGIYATYLCEDCVEFLRTLPNGYWAYDDCYYNGDLAMAKQLEGWRVMTICLPTVKR